MSKTRMGKRVASLLLSLVMMLSLLPTTVYATGNTGETKNEIVGQATTSGDNTEGTGEPEPTGEGEDGSANVTEGEDGAATNDAVVEETIAPVNAEGVDAVANAESNGDEASGEDGNKLVNFVTVNGDATRHETLDAAIKAATPDETGVITYNISGKVDVTATGWVQVATAGLTDLTAVKFVGAGTGAEICITGELAILADQIYDINVSFESLTLSKPNPAYGGDYGHSTNYFTTWLRNTGAAENTVTYTDCTFPNGVCNNQYGKTVFDNCQFANGTTGLYNLWVYGGNVELNGGTFTGVRGAKVYTEGNTQAKTPMTVDIKGTSFEGLTEKAAIVVSKAAAVTLTNVSATDCNKGLFQKAIEGSSNEEEVVIAPSGTNVSGTFKVDGNPGVGEADERNFNISAGTFTSKVSNDYCADGFEVKANADGTTYGVVEAATAAAQIGETTYETLAEAFAAAKDGDTITLLADTTEDVTINKNITLDLGGKTLTNTNAGKATISVTGGIVTVKNGTVIGGTSYYNIEVTKGSNANLTLEGVTATAGNTDSSMIDNFGNLTINSGTYTGGLDTVKNEPGAKLTINDGTFELKKGSSDGFTGVVFNYGNLTITGGTFIQSDKSAPYGQAQVIHTDKSGSSAPSTVITGGTFKNLCTRSTAWTVRATNAAAGATKVSGGTFNKSVSESYCADGFIPTKNADGTYDVKEGKYVAKSDTTKEKYDTLQAAIKATSKGKTVTLLTDVTENVEISKSKRVTLDLNGFTLNGGTGTAKAALTNYGTITIKDSSADKAGTIKRDDNGIPGETSYYVIRNRGTMTIERGTVINNSGYSQTSSIGSMNGSSLICNGDCNEGGTLTIKGGTFTQYNFIAIKNGALGVLHVTGGTITSNHSAIQNWFNADITGGEITGQLWTDAYKTGESVGKTTIGGDATFTGEIVMDIYANVAPELAITGGNLKVTKWNITTAAAKAGAKPAISGGTFTSAVPENYCAEGFIPTKNADGTYGVKEGKYVAQVGNVKYESLQAAIDAAGRKTTVTMLADTRENVTISTSDLTLDLNGFTLNGSTGERKPALTVTARVTVKDSSKAKTGTIMREDTAENSGVSSHYVIDVQKGLLTFESGTVKNNSGNKGGKGASLVRVGDDNNKKVHPVLTIAGGTFTQDNFIVIKVDFGTLYLKGGTVNSETSYAVENWLNANIKGDAVVNGAVSSWTYSTGSNSTLEISGGTVNGNVESVSYDGAEGKLAKVKITGGTVNGTLSTKCYNNATALSKDMATIEVTGGTFSSDPTKYVVEDSAVTPNADGTFGVAKAYLATVGETFYYTMEEAFKAQTASREPIVLLRDYTTGSPFRSGSINRTVDLNGHTWTCTGTDANSAAFEINYPNASLTVKNGKIVSSQLVGLIPSASGGTYTYDNSSLTFENVEMSTTATSGIETNGNNTNDTVTLKNSTLNVPNGFGIYFPSSGKLTIDNSKINAKTMGVQVCAGSLSINAGSAITVSGDAVSKTENDGAIQDGAAISIVNRTGYKGLGDVTVTGGTFTAKTGNAAIKAYDWKDNTESAFTANDKINVSGGTFSSAVPEGLCANGYISVANADGTHTVKKGVYVAEYNGTKYETLQKAIDAASQKNGGQTEVKLLCNLTITETVNFAKEYSAGSVLLNLGGYTLTGEGCRALQINKGSLYLENGTVTSTGIIDSSSVIRIGSNEETYNGATPMLYMQKDAKVVAPESYGVTIFGSATRGEKLKVMSNAEIIATGPSPAISGNGGANYNTDDRTSGWKAEEIIIGENAVISAANNYAIYHPECGTLNIQGGTITGTGGIQMCSGTLKISNSPKITANGSADYDYTGDAGVVYDAAAISVINRGYPQGPATVTIKGTPTVTAANGEVIHAFTWSNSNKTDGEWAEAGDYINVSGGTYNKQFNEAYLAADCTLVTNSEGGYTVEQKKVAEYNGTQYTSLSQAILDANSSGAKATVKLLDNVTLTSDLGIGGTEAVTLNLNMKTLTLDGAQIYTQGSAAVTINSGTIKCIDTPTSGSANDFAIQVMSGSSLTLGATSADTVTIKSAYGVYNAGGTLTVGHATITTDGWSVAVNDSASKTGVVTIGEGAIISSQNGNCIGTMVGSKPNVTITGGQLTSNGTAWDAGVIYWASEGTLTITGGTFTASSAEGSTAAAVYQKNGTVKISGTTAKLLGNNALVVKSGEGSTGTMITELSGGTYSTEPKEAWVVNGYRAIENTDGTYTVKEANIAIQVTSRIKDDGVTTVSTTTGGGMYCEGEKVTVTTSNVVGFKFLGWYEKDSYTTKLSADLSYTFTASKNCTLVALYSPAENATLTVKVTASAFRITGSKLVQNNGGMYKLPVGSSVTVTYTDKTYAFLYWVNGSDKIVSTSPEYTFTLGSNTELRACTSPKNTGNDNAMVVFKTAYDQVLTAKRYGNDEEIVFPMGPSKTGYKFIGWSMTQAEIRAAMAENDYIVVTPKYETLGTKYTVTVKYEGIEKVADTHTINVGDSILLTAAETVGEKTFSYWMIDDQIVSYLTTLTVFESKNVTVTAVYGVEANAEAKIRISDVSATQDGLYYLVTFTQAFALPEDATLVLTGFIRADDEESAANMNINRYSRIYKSSLTRNDGVYYQTIASKNADKTYYMMAFVQYKDAKGNLQTVYSECVKASYASLKGGN